MTMAFPGSGLKAIPCIVPVRKCVINKLKELVKAAWQQVDFKFVFFELDFVVNRNKRRHTR